ncbi:MAG: hypothetical protein ABIK37_03285 [candidate division WOR-3 bacterium]
MRRTVVGLLSVAGAFAILFSISCQRSNSLDEKALRIVSVNKGDPVRVDLADFGTYRDPEDPEADPVLFAVTTEKTVEVELQYVEIGLGLPTWTPYQASLRQFEATYRWVMGEEANTPPDRVRLPMRGTVVSDPSGDKTSRAMITIAPAAWQETYFDIPDDPFEGSEPAVYTATIKVSGYDDASGLALEAKADVEVSFANYWDDVSRIGQ